MKRLVHLFALLLVCCGKLPAQEDTLQRKMRWHGRLQFAGYQGLVSVGGGPVLAKGVWRPALMYGLAPAMGGSKAVHQIIIHNAIVLMPERQGKQLWASPVLSANLLIETGEHTFLRLPDRFPRGYYAAPQPHATLGLGGRLNKRLNGKLWKEIGFTAEFVGLDTYIWYGLSQRGAPLHQAFGLSFSLTTRF